MEVDKEVDPADFPGRPVQPGQLATDTIRETVFTGKCEDQDDLQAKGDAMILEVAELHSSVMSGKGKRRKRA
jgi:hypothetical protein